MSTKKLRWFLLSILILLFLAGCRCDNSVIPTYYGIGDTPAYGAVTSLMPSFDWHGSDSCDPDEYIFRIEEGGISTLGLVNTNIGPEGLPYTYVGGVGSPLQPGRSYTWYLTAVNGSQGNDPPVFGPKTEVGQFFTGPVCSGESLVAPDLLDPEPAGWVENDPYLFKWTYTGGCLPESYQLQFALDPGFTNISMTVNTTEPYAQEKLMTFLDCSSLWWRVRGFDGSSYGPWSAGRDFHYVLSGGCYQWHYLSDDFAWIKVRLYEDRCDQTGEITAWTAAPLNAGCMPDGMIIVGDGTLYNNSMRDFVVDLGAGPCPSTGLDQKTADYQAKFGVLTPGTYCVTISKNQTVDNYGPQNLMDGIWTAPRAKQILAEETVTFGPGNGDEIVRFVWDEPDRPILTLPLDFTYGCKFGPEDICDNYDFAQKGEVIPIFGRDANSEYKLTELNGTPCYILLPDAYLDERLAEMGGSLMAVDLRYFVPPEPCAPLASDPRPGATPTCSDYTTRELCGDHKVDGCSWNETTSSCDGP
jgi:hypothetical protein